MAASESFAEKEAVIVALGDSTTAGTPGFNSPAEDPPLGSGNVLSQYAYWLMKDHPEWKVLNRGVNGERSDQILKRFDKDVLANRPDAVVLLAGVNDLYQGYPAEHVQKSLEKMGAIAKKNGLKTVLATVLPYNTQDRKTRQSMESVNAWIRQFAKEQGFCFADTHAAVEDPGRKGFLADSPDGLHPGVEGYRKMAGAIRPALEECLKA